VSDFPPPPPPPDARAPAVLARSALHLATSARDDIDAQRATTVAIVALAGEIRNLAQVVEKGLKGP
jgi:hypothetical protein